MIHDCWTFSLGEHTEFASGFLQPYFKGCPFCHPSPIKFPRIGKRKTMDHHDEKVIYDYADKFISLAKDIFNSDKSGRVGMAIRYAAGSR